MILAVGAGPTAAELTTGFNRLAQSQYGCTTKGLSHGTLPTTGEALLQCKATLSPIGVRPERRRVEGDSRVLAYSRGLYREDALRWLITKELSCVIRQECDGDLDEVAGNVG